MQMSTHFLNMTNIVRNEPQVRLNLHPYKFVCFLDPVLIEEPLVEISTVYFLTTCEEKYQIMSYT